MHRAIIAVAVVVALLAIGTVAAVSVFAPGRGPNEPDAEREANSATEARSSERRRATPRRLVTRSETPAPAATPVAAQEIAEEASAADEPIGEEDLELLPQDEDVRTRVAALLDSLTEEEQRELGRLLRDRRMSEWRERRQRMLPSDMRLMGLRYYQGGAHQLSEGQQAQVEALRGQMEPRLQASLEGIWARQQELRDQAQTLASEGRQEEAQALFEQLGQLRQQENEVRQQLDQDYKQMLTGVLTPDQMQILEQEVRFGRRRGPSRDENGRNESDGN